MLRVAPILALCAGLGLKNDPTLIVDAHNVNPERNLSGWIKRLPALQVKSRKVQRAGHRRPINGGWRKEAAIKLAVLVRADAVDCQELAATIHHQDGNSAWPGEAHGAVRKFDCWKEPLGWHSARLGGECRRLLRQRCVELCGKNLAQALCLGIKWECSDNWLKEAHHDGASRLGIGESA